MLISFIVTSYNYSQYILETIESIKNQTFKDFEIIVVDDFSSDNSVEILEKISDIKLIKHSSNKGQLAAILSGLKEARGNLISIIDSDDVLYPDYAKIMSEYIKANDISFVNCNSSVYEKISTKSHPFGGWWWSPMSCAMFDKKYLEYLLKYPSPKKWRICPDKFIFNVAYLQQESLNINEKLLKKREHNKNAGKTKNRWFINLKNNLIIRSESLKIIKQKNLRKIIIASYPYLLAQILKKFINLFV
ncbi:glycosyltransferase family 2 protein [bacterium]|nr:glycosyltransferase family 2 protein [bacterium]